MYIADGEAAEDVHEFAWCSDNCLTISTVAIQYRRHSGQPPKQDSERQRPCTLQTPAKTEAQSHFDLRKRPDSCFSSGTETPWTPDWVTEELEVSMTLHHVKLSQCWLCCRENCLLWSTAR